MRAIIAFAMLTLAGCASLGGLPEQPAVTTGVVTLPPQTKVVRVPCIDPHELPPVPRTSIDPGPDLDKLANATLADYQAAVDRMRKQMQADIDAWRTYMLRADALLRGCVKELTEDLPNESART